MLQSRARAEGVETYLTEWVARTVTPEGLRGLEVFSVGGMWPGVFGFRGMVDWTKLGFASNSEFRFVGTFGRAGFGPEDLATGRTEGISSVFFAERSRYGFLVRRPGSPDFGVDPQYLTPISENFAVVCRQGD